MLPDAKNRIQCKLIDGLDVACCDGSHKQTAGLSHMGFAVWFGDCDLCNDECPGPPEEQQSTTKAKLRVSMLALDKKKHRVRLHVVTDSGLVVLRLQGKCAKWEWQG